MLKFRTACVFLPIILLAAAALLSACGGGEEAVPLVRAPQQDLFQPGDLVGCLTELDGEGAGVAERAIGELFIAMLGGEKIRR